MMGPGFGNALGQLMIFGIVFVVILAVFAVPVGVSGLAWLIAPRFGFDVDFLGWVGWSLLAWVPTLLGLAWWGR